MYLKNSFFCKIEIDTQRKIILNEGYVKDLENCDLDEFSWCLKDIIKIDRTGTSTGKLMKTTTSEDVLTYLEGWLTLLVNKLENNNLKVLEVITDILRFLRNCAVDFATQQHIADKTSILNCVDSVCSVVIDRDISNVTLKVLLQFLVNLISSNQNAGEKVFTMFYDKVRACLKANVHIYEISALIYYISLSKPIVVPDLIDPILQLFHADSENEFLIFFIENGISSDDFWTVYMDIKTEHKTMVLVTLKNMLLQKRVHNLPRTALEVLTDEFLKLTNSIFSIIENENGPVAYYISLLLEILSSLSSDEVHLKSFQTNKNLLVNAGALLINIHKLGKESQNCFTPVQNLKEFSASTELNDHPAFGFKADLIRFIGNLCWKNKAMQDLVRTAELIPVILDCCNMDARNPFIIQWSILAVRNLCENNDENQKIIAGLHQEGTVSSEVLNEMGMALHSDGERDLKIIPLENLKRRE